MTTLQEELQAFEKMWTWLASHPAHDQEYYMKHVARLPTPWKNSCPLCHSSGEGPCINCKALWQSDRGSLCTDKDSPLNKWRQTAVEDPDNRTWYASKIAMLGKNAARGKK